MFLSSTPFCVRAQTLSSDTSEWKKPNQGAKVQARMVGRLQDGTVFEDYDADFVTDEGAPFKLETDPLERRERRCRRAWRGRLHDSAVFEDYEADFVADEGAPLKRSQGSYRKKTMADHVLCPAAEFVLCQGRVQLAEGIGPCGAEDEQGDSHSCRCKQLFG